MALQASNFPTTKPELTLDFANSRCLDPRITFARASIGTYVDERGILQIAPSNVARFDHNPTTGESLGLLVEEPRTNLLLRSEEFDNASWGVLNATVSANTQVAPDGVTSADTITDVNGVTSANVGCFQTTTLADSTTYAMSCYVKAGTKTTCRVGIRDKAGTTISANFNLTTASTTVGNAVSSTIQDAGNGWYRCTAICASLTGATSPRGLVYMDTGSYTANGTGTIHVWGAQLEAGAFPSSYILNVNTPLGVTRSADVVQITGTEFSSWYRQDEGTFYADVLYGADISGMRLFYTQKIADGFSTRHGLIGGANSGSTTGPYGETFVSGVSQASLNQGAPVANTRYLTAYAAKKDDFAFTRNGATTSVDTSGDLPLTQDQALIGSDGSGNNLNGTIRRLVYWRQRLPNAALQTLTSS